MRILIVDDEPRFAAILAQALRQAGHSAVDTAPSAEAALTALARARIDLLVTDLRLPGMDGIALMAEARRRHPGLAVVLMTAFAEVATVRDALLRGAMDYLVKPFDNDDLLALVERARPCADHPPEAAPGGMVGASPAMRRLRDDLARIARSQASALILGESGTGKELAARAIHDLSPRHAGPFIEINAAALPETMLESELFGHERGAFTGADRRKPGLVEMAEGGTLFLDEIGELPLHLQPKLLRFLQERRFYRVGGTEVVTVDTRVVAATNRDLAAQVRDGRFREDLLFRLDVASVRLPPLRDREGDVPLLVSHLLARHGLAPGRIAPEALAALERHRWPGNVRELANAVERAVILADGGMIGVEHLGALGEPSSAADDDAPIRSLDANERQLIARALDDAAGNKAEAARQLGITRRRLYSRLKLLGMEGGHAAAG